MQTQTGAEAGPSRPRQNLDGPRKPQTPFVSKENRPDRPDGKYRVVLISSGSVASIKVPDIVGSLIRNRDIELQVVGTAASLRFYDQAKVDEAVRKSIGHAKPGDDQDMGDDEDIGVKVWTDEDEWSDWKQVGDPILHIELRRWADLVLVAPCSADMLAKIAGGICDNLATSLLRALSPDTPTILFPAMNTHMYSHPLTNDHLNVVQEKLGYMVSGPQGAGRLACGDEGPGKMTDWRDIVTIVEDMAVMHRAKFAEARIFRELGPGTGTQGAFSLDLHPNDSSGLASRGLSSLIAADRMRKEEHDLDAMGIRFSSVKEPLEYNGFQPGLRTERHGDLEMKEPMRMRNMPLVVDHDTDIASTHGWSTKHMPFDSTSSNTGPSQEQTKDPLVYNGNQVGLSVEQQGQSRFREPIRMAGVINNGGGHDKPNGGWGFDPKGHAEAGADIVKSGPNPVGNIVDSWDKLKRTVHSPIEVNGNERGLTTDKPPSMAADGASQPRNDETDYKASDDLNAFRMFGGAGKDQSWWNGYQQGLSTAQTGLEREPPRMSVPCMSDNKWDNVGWGSTLQGHAKAPDVDGGTSQPGPTSPPRTSSVAHFEHFNAPRKPSSGPHEDLAWNNFLPGLKTDRERSPDVEPTRMHVPTIDSVFTPPIGSMSFGRAQNPPASFGTSLGQRQNLPQSPLSQSDGFRKSTGDHDDLVWNNGQRGLASQRAQDESEPARMEVHIYTTPSGTISRGTGGPEGGGSVIPRTAL